MRADRNRAPVTGLDAMMGTKIAHGICKGNRMRIRTALVILVLSATPVLAQTITNTRDANGNLPRDKGISANTNPTNAPMINAAPRPPAPSQPTIIERRRRAD
jgi:hypothetical protein